MTLVSVSVSVYQAKCVPTTEQRPEEPNPSPGGFLPLQQGGTRGSDGGEDHRAGRTTCK